ncbi:hypothetical protein LR48_Vigan03g125300 [Vigna angularis]|uniref:F-box/LRR-repeat protein n=2 Tax=Phaseolus angularis TaxID=3914 RepID=A0A0L9U511_PHAAN|nr:F-box/FBD/LRR-repeat protein At5g22660 [Vigna angularis]KAG2404824.1 F-box/LRR-repeat protein [Vigna angularis]KOM37871.1 hypothetical protein LR48_Vigan03g125300 [Vigna angularis]BAT84320.1 hypothetical protein VIGAN_04165200 [Vigna angularis var. angularis]
MVEPSAKILRRTLDENLDGETDNIDRLSALPESILLYIISFLELREAAATSILSTTWRDLFLQFRSIVATFNEHGVFSSEHHRLFDLFVGFVNRMLRERNPEIPIKVIRVTVKNFTERMKLGYESLMMSTAFAMSTCKVETIDYSFDMCFERTEPPSIVLPSEMFISETLTGLRLILPKGWVLPEKVWLPKLRYAHLIPFRLVDENSIQRFLDGCPRLENVMFIMKDETTKVKNLHMSSSSLKFVMLDWHVIEETNMSITVKAENLLRLFLSLRGGHKVNLDAPNLKFFSIEGQALELNMIQSVPSMEQATIATDCMFHFSDWNDFYSRSAKTCAFFGEFQNLRSLNISEPIMKALYVSKPVMPTFRNLYKIRLIPRYCKDDFTRYWIAHVLFNLFEKCPNLQVLSFKKVFDNYFGEVDFESVFPVSMVQNLKKLEICDFRGLEMEYKLVEFFMNNGQSLVIVSLKKNYSTPYNYLWKQNQRDRILSFLTHRDECAIVFK